MKILTEKIDALLETKSSVIIAIDGQSGSGKSTICRKLSSLYKCNAFHMDDFFLRTEQRTAKRYSEPGGNVDYERFYEEVIYNLKKEGSFQYNIFDCKTKAFKEKAFANVKRLNIVEGVYSMHPLLKPAYDLCIFLKIPYEEQIKRIIKRNGNEMANRFINEWIPLENRYFNELRIESKCDIILNGFPL